jgi:predicted AAA+ superfamily ATPase
MLRFWTMLAHSHAQVWNAADPARSLGISMPTVRRYLDFFTGLYLVRQLQPWHENLGKRQVKAPKLYIRDSGLLHALLAIGSARDLAAHNKLGASWEGFAVETAVRAIGKRGEELTFWGTHSGAEVDLFWQEHGRNWAIEVKYADAPRFTPSMASALEDLGLTHLWVVYPGDRAYPLAANVSTLPLTAVEDRWQYP